MLYEFRSRSAKRPNLHIHNELFTFFLIMIIFAIININTVSNFSQRLLLQNEHFTRNASFALTVKRSWVENSKMAHVRYTARRIVWTKSNGFVRFSSGNTNKRKRLFFNSFSIFLLSEAVGKRDRSKRPQQRSVFISCAKSLKNESTWRRVGFDPF